MNFHINTKALEALSYADLGALSEHLLNIANLRSSSMAHVIPANFSIDACNDLSMKIFKAKSQKLEQQGIISFFSGDSIENKPIHEREFSARTINAIRGHFGLNSHKEITVQHLKIIHNVGSEYVRGLGVACQREIRWYLEELGIIDKQ